MPVFLARCVSCIAGPLHRPAFLGPVEGQKRREREKELEMNKHKKTNLAVRPAGSTKQQTRAGFLQCKGSSCFFVLQRPGASLAWNCRKLQSK